MPDEAPFTVTSVCAMYLWHARRAYTKHGERTSHVPNVLMALRELRDAYGNKPAAAFEAPDLAKLRDRMIWRDAQQTSARSTKTVNGRLKIITQAFQFAREKGKVPKETVADLMMVTRLRKGRSEAKNSKAVKPIHETAVEYTENHLATVVKDMVRLLNITGMRPQEVCYMRQADLETTGELWLYRPTTHKLEHMEDQGETVRILGPRSQEIIRPYLTNPNLSAYLFSPKAAQAERLERKRKDRKTPLYPSHEAKRRDDPTSHLGDHYTTETLRRAIHYACKKAGIEPWNPNQLRHAVATRTRKAYGLEGASLHLGHKVMSTTELYAEKNAELAMRIAREVG